MARLPPGFSLQAGPIQAALSEGRTPDAKRLICEILLAGRADAVVQKLAAEMILPKKKPRGRQKAFKKFWFDIGMEFNSLRGSGVKYEDALSQLSKKFGFGETHIRNAVREYEEAREAHEEATRDAYEEWAAKERTRT